MPYRIALFVALAFASVSLRATTYTIDPRHTQGVISWSHLGFSNPTGKFSMVRGTLQFDPAAPTRSAVTTTIPIAELNTGVSELNDYLQEATFFDIAHFPIATFTSTKVEKTSSPIQLKVIGDLSLRGVTRTVTIDVTINKIGTDPRSADLAMVGFEATTILKRSEFGLGKFVGLVSDDVKIHITCQAIESKGYAQHMKADALEGSKDAEHKAELAEAAAQEAASAKRDAVQQNAIADYAAAAVLAGTRQ
jgi:polyisoprenoid-binding protein YceI